MKKLRKGLEPFTRSLSDLPCGVTCNILIRLPIKSCLTCKFVCKEWYDIIMSTHFADLRRTYGSDRRRVTLLLHFGSSKRKWNFAMLEIDKTFANVDRNGYLRVGIDSKVKFNCNLDFPKEDMHVCNACNGLVGLQHGRSGFKFYVCNLLTSQCVMVDRGFHNTPRFVCGFGLGFCSVTCQYKILIFHMLRNNDYVAEILTLGTDTWRSVAGAPQYDIFVIYKTGPLLNGSLHFCCFGRSTFKDILAFEFGAEKLSNVVIPHDLRSKIFLEVTVLDSCLCVCFDSEDDRKTEVWIMKEYGMGDSWVKQFVIHKPEYRFPYVPVVQMDDGQILVKARVALAFYNPETGNCADIKVRGAAKSNVMMTCDVDFLHMLGAVRRTGAQNLHKSNDIIAS